MLKDKRGMTLNQIYPAVLLLILIGIVLGIGLYILSEARISIAQKHTATEMHNSTSTITVDQSGATNFYMYDVTSINDTLAGTAITIPDANWTRSGSISVGSGNNVTVIYEYIYDAAGKAETTLSTAVTGLAGFADWIAIIVTVIAAAVVLGIVLNSFGRQPGV